MFRCDKVKIEVAFVASRSGVAKIFAMSAFLTSLVVSVIDTHLYYKALATQRVSKYVILEQNMIAATMSSPKRVGPCPMTNAWSHQVPPGPFNGMERPVVWQELKCEW